MTFLPGSRCRSRTRAGLARSLKRDGFISNPGRDPKVESRVGAVPGRGEHEDIVATLRRHHHFTGAAEARVIIDDPIDFLARELQGHDSLRRPLDRTGPAMNAAGLPSGSKISKSDCSVPRVVRASLNTLPKPVSESGGWRRFFAEVSRMLGAEEHLALGRNKIDSPESLVLDRESVRKRPAVAVFGYAIGHPARSTRGPGIRQVAEGILGDGAIGDGRKIIFLFAQVVFDLAALAGGDGFEAVDDFLAEQSLEAR